MNEPTQPPGRLALLRYALLARLSEAAFRVTVWADRKIIGAALWSAYSRAVECDSAEEDVDEFYRLVYARNDAAPALCSASLTMGQMLSHVRRRKAEIQTRHRER